MGDATLVRRPAGITLSMNCKLHPLAWAAALLMTPVVSQAQFIDNFDGPKLEGWSQLPGDGTPTMSVEQKQGFIRYKVDATTDKHGVWWTFIKRDITSSLDMEKLKDPAWPVTAGGVPPSPT